MDISTTEMNKLNTLEQNILISYRPSDFGFIIGLQSPIELWIITFVDRTDGINSKTPLLIWLTDSSDEYFDKRSNPRGCNVLKMI